MVDKELHDLMVKGKGQGYLTYDEVNDYLPDEAVTPEKLDNLLVALEEAGIELLNEAPVDEETVATVVKAAPVAASAAAKRSEAPAPSAPTVGKLSDDPIRLYLSQMAEIPLLSRAEEIALAKKIEVTRKRFRRSVLGCNYSMQATVETLKKVHQGVLPFDRTIKVSLTEQLTKEQILARMPHNLRTLDNLVEQNTGAFRRLISKRATREERSELKKQFLRRRRKALTLVEELSLRTRRVQAMMPSKMSLMNV